MKLDMRMLEYTNLQAHLYTQMPTCTRPCFTQIAVEATNFLGATSKRVTAAVYKSSVPSPQIKFTPSSLSIMRSEAAFIKAEAFFSACPVDTSKLVFTWSQVSGPAIPAQYLATTNPQLFIPANTLEAGSTFVLSLAVTMSGDKSVSSNANFVLKTGAHHAPPAHIAHCFYDVRVFVCTPPFASMHWSTSCALLLAFRHWPQLCTFTYPNTYTCVCVNVHNTHLSKRAQSTLFMYIMLI